MTELEQGRKYKLVNPKRWLVIKIAISLAFLAAVGLLALLVLDTRHEQGRDRVVIRQISKSPCAGLSVAECQRKIVTPEYLAKVLPRALRRAGLTAGSLGKKKSRPGARARAGRRRSGAAAAPAPSPNPAPGGSAPTGSTPSPPDNPPPGPPPQTSPPAAAPAAAEPQPAPSPSLVPALPVLPQLPDVCVATPLAAACVTSP